MDIFATALELNDISYNFNRKLDGASMLSVLTDSVKTPIHEKLCWRSGYNRAIRYGDWKLITDNLSGNHALYNVRMDKEEQLNLYDDNPEMVELLRNAHAEWEAEMINPAWPRVMDYRWWDGDEPYYFPL
jgi:arylsulfatase A-like enzyme